MNTLNINAATSEVETLAFEPPTDHDGIDEAQVMYAALKAAYETLHPHCSVEQHTAAMKRFQRLSGV